MWNARTLKRTFSAYSTYDVGDVFSLAFSERLQTVYVGAQNTSIQWFSLAHRNSLPPNLSMHPSQRTHRFFDSTGPSGVSTPRPLPEPELEALGGELIEISQISRVPYAHFGYVYCMILAPGLATASPEGEHLISGGGDGLVKLWKVDNHNDGAITELEALQCNDNSVFSIALNGTLLYAGCLEGEVQVWDLDARQLVRTVKAHESDILTLSVGHGAIHTGAVDGRCKAFDRQICKADWEAHKGFVLTSALATYKHKPYLVTGGNDGRINVWDLHDLASMAPGDTPSSNEQLVQSLSRFVSFRTVSSQPEYAEDCHQGASWLRNRFKRLGATTQMLTGRLPDGNEMNPVIFAHFRGRGTSGKRMLFYGHYDVVAAAEGTSKWLDNPFQIQGRDGYLYGRGVSDNKGPVMAAMYATADLRKEDQLDIDVVFLIEGEEECGSQGFESVVHIHKDTIGPIHWILVANSYWLNDDFPCLTYGLRGAVKLTVGMKSENKDLHSGVHGSTRTAEPLQDLVQLLAGISDAQGRIQIPGFYDDILPISKAEEKWYARIREVMQQANAETEDIESLKARWTVPSFTIHGFKTSGTGDNATVIPHWTSASISFRLVPNQNAAKVEHHIKNFLADRFRSSCRGSKMNMSSSQPVEPWLGDPRNELYQVLDDAVTDTWNLNSTESFPESPEVAQAINKSQGAENIPPAKRDPPKSFRGGLKEATGVATSVAPRKTSRRGTHSAKPTRPLYIREGGSIPAIRFLEKEFNCPAAQLPCGQASDNAHLDNERLRLLNLYNSRKIFRKIFKDLGSKQVSKGAFE